MAILEINHLKKSFGQQTVLKDVHFSVKEHTIFGFIGQNGAGKTTTMKAILGLLKIDSGNITVCNEQVNYGNNQTNQYIGYLPDVPEFYSFMTPLEYLELCGQVTHMAKHDILTKSQELIELVGLSAHAKKRISGFSRGMKQRLGIAQALLNNPKLLICDEPTSALDPIGRKDILDILQKVKDKTTIIFSTHILSDVERVCDEIAILNEGQIVFQGSLEDVKAKHPVNALSIQFYDHLHIDDFMNTFSDLQIIPEEHHRLTIHSKDIYTTEMRVFHYLYQNHIKAEKVIVEEPTLENLFMEVVK